MARSVKKVTPRKKVAIKKTVKKAGSKKSAPVKSSTKKASTKKASAKKAMPGKSVTKRFIVKKGSEKKASTAKLTPKKVPVKKAAIKKTVIKKATPTKKELNDQTAKANDYTEMIEDGNLAAVSNHEENILNKNENEVINSSNDDDKMVMASHAIPAPVEKYARPADPYHGNKAPVKRRSNIAPSGKKPLWNK